MNSFHWFEAKQLDRVTNFSTEVEIIKYANANKIQSFYYCTFAREKKYYGLDENIKYIGNFKNRYIKFIEFQIVVILKAIEIVLKEKQSVIMVNQDLIKHMLPALWLNKLFKRKNKFTTDIRTTPTVPATFDSDMLAFHSQFRFAVKYFDGFSFITPFMEKYVMSKYNIKEYSSVTWSSGADLELFDINKHNSLKELGPLFTVFYHGGISESRGNLCLIKACQQLINEGYELELIQIGICVDKTIPEYIESRGLRQWCKLLPPVPLEEIPKFVANADLPVLPFPNFMAWRVSSPIKLMEYLAMGKKVLAPDMEAFTDVFGKKSNLVFYYDVTREDPASEMAMQIKRIIDNKLLESSSPTEMVQFVEERYTWTKQASKLLDYVARL